VIACCDLEELSLGFSDARSITCALPESLPGGSNLRPGACCKHRGGQPPKAARQITGVPMSDPNKDPQAKLKDLIRRASTGAEINFKKGREVAPLGFAIRENGSRFAFKPIPEGSNAETVSMIRASFAQHKIVSYVLTVAASSESKQFAMFSAEDKSGMMVGQREIIMQPTPHLGPLEIIDSNVAEGRFVGLLPHQERPLTTQ